ncbi:hypothetical protein C6400_03240 [Klebsiella michiganensis]|nr:hypothetical protein [Klebsiella michiganensis]PSJ02093.1 hypothetical protein C6400_03240 [Klebsiella michiganensis]
MYRNPRPNRNIYTILYTFSIGFYWIVTDNDGLKISKIFINHGFYGWVRTFGEVEMVPIIGVEPTTFADSNELSTKPS